MDAIKRIDRAMMDAGIWADVEETEELYIITVDGDWIQSHRKAVKLMATKFFVMQVDEIPLEEHENDGIRATDYKSVHLFSKMI